MKILIVKRHPIYDKFLPLIYNAIVNTGHIAEITESNNYDTIVNKIREFKPDFLFCISIFIWLSEIGKITGTPVIHYELDKVMTGELLNPKNYSARDYFFFTYKEDALKFTKLGFGAWYLPFSFNILRHSMSQRNYQHSVSFVGSLISDRNNSYIKYFNALKEKMSSQDLRVKYDLFLNVIEKILSLQEEASEKNTYILPQLLEKLELSFFDKNRMTTLLAKESVHRQRSFFLRNIPDLTIYGDDDWKNITWNNINYLGSVEQYSEVSKVFFQSKINIDITRIYNLDGFSDRIFNVLYSNGFLLATRTGPLLELFDDKKELAAYSTLEELRDLINYYLNNENEREKIAQAGYEKVLREHSFEKRIQFMLKQITGV